MKNNQIAKTLPDSFRPTSMKQSVIVLFVAALFVTIAIGFTTTSHVFALTAPSPSTIADGPLIISDFDQSCYTALSTDEAQIPNAPFYNTRDAVNISGQYRNLAWISSTTDTSNQTINVTYANRNNPLTFQFNSGQFLCDGLVNPPHVISSVVTSVNYPDDLPTGPAPNFFPALTDSTTYIDSIQSEYSTTPDAINPPVSGTVSGIAGSYFDAASPAASNGYPFTANTRYWFAAPGAIDYQPANNSLVVGNNYITIDALVYYILQYYNNANTSDDTMCYGLNGKTITFPNDRPSASFLQANCSPANIDLTMDVIIAEPTTAAPKGNVTMSCNASDEYVLSGQAYDPDTPTSSVNVYAAYAGDSNPIVGMAKTTDGAGYWLVDSTGKVFNFGDAHQGIPYTGTSTIVGIAASSNGGYWLVGSDGDVYSFAGAPYYGSISTQTGKTETTSGTYTLNPSQYVANYHLSTTQSKAAVGIVAYNGGTGYWIVANDGGVFSFNAPYEGSAAGSPNNAPIVAMAASPNNTGYWLLGADGSVYTEGTGVGFGGSEGSSSGEPQPFVGIAAASNSGYWLVSKNGTIYPLGTTTHGEATQSSDNIVGITASSESGTGYWTFGSNGGVYGEAATYYGNTVPGSELYPTATGVSTGGTPPNNTYSMTLRSFPVIEYGDTNMVITVYAEDSSAGPWEAIGTATPPPCANHTLTCVGSAPASVPLGDPITGTAGFSYSYPFGGAPSPGSGSITVSIKNAAGTTVYGPVANAYATSGNSDSASSPYTYTPTTGGTYSITWNVTGTFTLTNCGPTANAGGGPTTTIVYKQPYLKVYGGDEMVGAGFASDEGLYAPSSQAPACQPDTNAGAYTFDHASGSVYSGSSTSQAAFVANLVSGFDSSNGLAAPGSAISPANRPKSLTFANDGSGGSDFNVYGGDYADAPCSGGGGGTESYYTALSSSPYAIPEASQLISTLPSNNPAAAAHQVYLYTNNLLINNNVTYSSTSGWNSLNSMPILYVVVHGADIYINSSVSTLDGVYIAEPVNGVGGQIYTCNASTTAIAIPSTGSLFDDCSSPQLTVNGAFIAKDIHFLRTGGSSVANGATTDTIGQNCSPGGGADPGAAETFCYTPNLWLANPYKQTTGGLTDITTLPPVL